ncbi:MAG: hypothetical protein CMA89_05140 [Euryarchaeota archaeon]|nr:hypothetical protein [Euryarchaeota archaeon]
MCASVITPRGRAKAIGLVVLMILLPWGSNLTSPSESKQLSADSDFRDESSGKSWGVNGSNDTGWLVMDATGADPANGTPALADIFLEFAPGAVIDNLTLEISVNGSDGYWANQPQIAVMDTQTSVLDWSGRGDLGRQNNFADNPPSLVGGILDASLKPNTNSDASWQIPTGIEITDLVMEALRPVDPKLSFSPLEVSIHGSAYNPTDGRMHILVDDDLLQLDDNANKPIIDIDSGIGGRSIVSDPNRGLLYVGDSQGNVTAITLSDSQSLADFPIDTNSSLTNPILTMGVDVFGVLWAFSECNMHYLMPSKGAIWKTLEFCTTSDIEIPVGVHTEGRELFLATQDNGVRVIEYNVSSSDPTSLDVERNIVWDSSNYLSGDSIADILVSEDTLYIATSDSGIDRFDLSSGSWMPSWTSSNWLSSDSIVGLATAPGWLYILGDDQVQPYDTDVLLFSSDIQLGDLGLAETASSISAWPGGLSRAPSASMAIIGDSSGTFGRVLEDNPDGSFHLVSSPSIDDAEVTAIIDDGEAGEFWIASGSIIDIMDKQDNLWKEPIDLGELITSQLEPGDITSIEQDEDGWVWIGTTNSGVHRLSNVDGSYFETIQGLNSNSITSLAYDSNTDILVIGHVESGISLYSTDSNNVIETYSESEGLDSDMVRDIATRFGIAYIATEEAGVMRIDLGTPAIIGSWQSLGVDNLDATPVAVDGEVIYLGLPGLGVLLIDRLTSDIVDLWTPDDPNGIPDEDVNTLSLDFYGGLLIGSEVQNSGASANGGLARWDGSTWDLLPTSIPGWNNDPFEFYDVSSDANGVYAGTNRGACMWNWPDPNNPQSQFTLEDCWTSGGGGGGGGGGDGMPSRFVIAVDPIGPDLLYAGTTEGAAVINTSNGTVVEVWTAGDDTERARVLKFGEILYLGFENLGIARFNLTSGNWLTPWDGSQGILGDDDVTVMIEGRAEGTMWAGGDFGLTLIDLVNETTLIQWDRGDNQDGPTLPPWSPAEILIVEGVMYYSPQRGNPWNARDEVTRINLDNNSTLDTIDAGQRLGFNGVIHGMNQIGDEVWISVVETSGWGGSGDPGTILRWNTTSDDWEDDLQTIGDVGRVNAQYLGDCFPLNSSCEMWVAYGDNILRRFSVSNMTLLDQWNDVDGRIRGMVEYQGEYLFASMNGILRWNPSNETWQSSWLPGDGLPSDSELDFYSLKVVGDDLWAASGYGNDGHIMRLSGNNSNWTIWDVDTSDIPDGYGADILLCHDIVHIAIGFSAWQWWAVGGGIARFDLGDHDGDGITEEWISPITSDNSNMVDKDVRALACDEENEIMYVGFDTDNVGIDRFDYSANNFLDTLTPEMGVSENPVFPGGMLYDEDLLLVSHYDGNGGITRVITSGSSATSGQVIGVGMDSCSIVRAPTASRSYAIGRSGDLSGINRVDRLDSTGLIEGGFDELVGLPSGVVHEMISNETHVWVTVGSSEYSYLASTVLQGELLDNGSVNWQYGFDALSESINEIMLLDDEIWATTVGNGLFSFNLSQRTVQQTPPALHNQMDGLLHDGENIFIGLMGWSGSSAGFQTFNPETRTWGQGSLLAGLPSNIVTDFVEYGEHVLVSTHGGIGLWNLTKYGWDDPITTVDGLPTPITNHLFVPPSPILGNGTVLVGGPTGLVVLDQNLGIVGTIGRTDGLVGDFVSGIVYAGPASRTFNDTSTGSTITLYHDSAIFISHNGQGVTRPGVAAWDISTDSYNGTYNIDMIPSNDVTAVETDLWGVHIATSNQPLVHWNGSSMVMEAGPGAIDLQAWPIIDLASDGNHLAAISESKISIVRTTGDHDVVMIGEMPGALDADADAWMGLAVLGEDGLHIYKPMETLREVPRENQRRAFPLNAIFADRTIDITDTTRPGMFTTIVTQDSPISIPIDQNQANSSDLLLYPGSLTFSSPAKGSWVWAKSTILNYTGSWDLAALDPRIEESFQTAIFNTPPGSLSSTVHLQMQSPQDGRIKIRVSYDWERLEAPTVMTGLYDRPNDGGGVLHASWLPAQDSAWSAYRIYLWDSTDDPQWTPSKEDLSNLPSYQRVPYWSQTTAVFTTGNSNGSEVQLSDQRQYRAAVAIEYPDGSLGEPISWDGNATPTDETPSPPEWLEVQPVSGGTPGTVSAEWSSCQELDPQFTRIWAVQQEITNALALSDPIDFAFAAGNSSVLELEGNVPYWFAIVCVDEAGQFDPANATVVGPVVTAGGLNDGIAPAPITGTTASDAPNDEGGRIIVTWEPNQEEDCSFHVIYILPASGWTAPTSVDGWPVAQFVTDCTTDEVVIDSIGNSTLENDVVYWIGVVAVDDWGNQNVNDVLVVETASYSEFDSTEFTPPDMVSGLQAWDHPDDDGTAIDVSWDRSMAEDFSHYTVWASDFPMNDLTEVSPACESSGACNLVTIDQRQIGNSPHLEVTLSSALYGTEADGLSPSRISPDIPLYVTVTIHDIAGNVILSDLSENMALVTPIDNRGDLFPPERVPAPTLVDRSPDSGDGILVSFSTSPDPDIAEYRIFAVAGVPFDSAEGLEPVLVLDRTEGGEFLLESLSSGESIQPDVPMWVAVVSVDTSGNAWLDGLETSMISPVDENSQDPGMHLPEVSEVMAYWDSTGSRIEVLWSESADPQVESYTVFASTMQFFDTRDAIIVSSSVTSNASFDSIGPTPVSSSTPYWLSVVAFDGEVHRLAVDSIRVYPLSELTPGGTSEGPGVGGESWFDQLVDGDLNTAILMVSAIMVILGAALIIRPREKTAPQPWEMGTQEVEMEEELTREAMGISEEEEIASSSILSESQGGEDPDEDLPGTTIEDVPDEEWSVPDVSVADLLNSETEEISLEGLNDLADGLDEEENTDIDVSFLDDVLDDD